MKRLNIYGLLLVGSLAIGCGSGREVTRVDPNTQMDISGRWNDTDSRQVADEMTSDVLSRPWLARFNEANDGAAPVVIIGDVINKSHEHIASETFIKDIERAFVNSGKVRLVENAALREKMREELESQQGNATEESKKKLAQELGADYIMFGTINSTVDAYKKEKVIAYKVNLELVTLETTEKVWIGDKEIKKYVKN
ncbi:MAG: penicillin-binding protein activator LpoB [Salibacteraceae bacterium]